VSPSNNPPHPTTTTRLFLRFTVGGGGATCGRDARIHWAHADPVRRRFIPLDQRQRFTWDGTGDDTAVIAASIGHWRYRDHYTSPDSQEEDAGDIHGPYLVAAITPTEFVPLDQAGAVAGIEEFCGLFDIPPRVRGPRAD
jgi:hypothetical protein